MVQSEKCSLKFRSYKSERVVWVIRLLLGNSKSLKSHQFVVPSNVTLCTEVNWRSRDTEQPVQSETPHEDSPELFGIVDEASD